MRGNFDINNSSYPIAALPVGDKRYRVTNMLYLEPLRANTARGRQRDRRQG